MDLKSTVESLSYHAESFLEQLQEVQSWISAWDGDPRNKTDIQSVDFGMTKRACLTIIVNAQSVESAIHLIGHAAYIDFSEFMAKGVGMTALEWAQVLDDFENADGSPSEHPCRVVLDVLGKAEMSVREFLHNKVEPAVLSERLGPQARLAFQHYLFFHREHMKDAFLTLQGLLVHGLNRRSADLPLLVYRIEQMLSVVKSIVMTPSEKLSHEHQDHAIPDINSLAVPKRETPLKARSSTMTSQDTSNQMAVTHPLVKLTATFRRMISMTEVAHDTIGPWLRGRRAIDVIEFSDINAEAIGSISVNLLKHFIVTEMLLGLQTESRQEFESVCREAEQDAAGPVKSKLVDESQLLLSLVSRFAKETTDQVRGLAASPTKWVVKQGLDSDLDSLDRTLRSLDCTRWQILKGFAKLVVIFDDSEDPASDEPCEASREDSPATDPD